VHIDTVTDAPTLDAPTAGATVSGPFAVHYSLPEAPLGGSVNLTFSGAQDYVLNLYDPGVGSHSLLLNPDALSPSLGVFSVLGENSIASGVYSVIVSYRDSLGNQVASSTAAAGVTVVRAGAAPPAPPASVSGLSGAKRVTTAAAAIALLKSRQAACRRLSNAADRRSCLAGVKLPLPTFSFNATAAQPVTLRFTIIKPGHKAGGRCVAGQRAKLPRAKRCKATVTELSTQVAVAAPGAVKAQLTRGQWRKLRAGRTTVTAAIGDSTSLFSFVVR
jgi:hypothetical protein